MTGDSRNAALENAIMPRTRDLGDGFEVRRALPSAQRRMVGPFVFFDQMGPVVLGEGRGLDVRPHPHLGLATVTYLFDGEIVHRDSLGNAQPIRPGAVNWMTAGRGIVHSERTPPELRAGRSSLFGIQTWVALPKGREEMAPGFAHHGADALPVIEDDGKRLRLIAGSLYGERAPVDVFSEMFYADAALPARLGSTFRRSMKNGQPGSPRAASRLAATCSTPAGCSFFGPARRWRSRLWTLLG